MKKFFGFGSSTPPPPPPPPLKPAAAPAKTPPAAAPAPAPPRPAAPVQPTPAPAPSIVGRWTDPAGSDQTEFHADGSVVEKLGSGETIRGRYVLSGNKLQVTLEGVPDALSFTVVIAASTLAMTDADGQTTNYQRL